jgi:hypothetical protein
MPPRPARPARRPTGRRVPAAELRRRLAELEARVTALETGRASPGDGRAASTGRVKAVVRCPGCGLPLERRAGRCAACGRPLDRR